MTSTENSSDSQRRRRHYAQQLAICQQELEATHCPNRAKELEGEAMHFEYEMHLS